MDGFDDHPDGVGEVLARVLRRTGVCGSIAARGITVASRFLGSRAKRGTAVAMSRIAQWRERDAGRRKDGRECRPEPTQEEAPGWPMSPGDDPSRPHPAYTAADSKQRYVRAEWEADDMLGCQLLGSISYELYTPIASIVGLAASLRDISKERFLPAPEEEEWLAAIELNAARLRGLVDDLLDLSRLEAGVLRMQFEWVEIEDMLANLRPDLERIADTRTLLILRGRNGACPLVRCDERWIRKVITELVENAAKFSPPESTIVVGIERYEGGVRIGVRDQGEGIPTEHWDRVFERFYQVEGAGSGGPRGAGLGLAICRGIVEEHGGRIWVESRVGQGSTFHVALPAHRMVGATPGPALSSEA